MKLCQKCEDQIASIGPDSADETYWKIHIVPEPECEFYLHKELNRWKTLTERELGGMPKW